MRDVCGLCNVCALYDSFLFQAIMVFHSNKFPVSHWFFSGSFPRQPFLKANSKNTSKYFKAEKPYQTQAQNDPKRLREREKTKEAPRPSAQSAGVLQNISGSPSLGFDASLGAQWFWGFVYRQMILSFFWFVPQTGLPVRGSYSFERGMILHLSLGLFSCMKYALDALAACFYICLPLVFACLPPVSH